MIIYKDMKRLQNLFNELTNRKLGFKSIKNNEEWVIFEVKND